MGGARGHKKTAVYKNSEQLAGLGYLEAVTIGAPSKAVTAYMVTPKGSDAIRRWMRTPTERPHLDSEIFLRVRALEIVPAEDALSSLSALRPQLTMWLAGLDDVKAKATSTSLALTLELEYFELVLRAHLKWLDQAEKALKKRIREKQALKRRKGQPLR